MRARVDWEGWFEALLKRFDSTINDCFIYTSEHEVVDVDAYCTLVAVDNFIEDAWFDWIDDVTILLKSILE